MNAIKIYIIHGLMRVIPPTRFYGVKRALYRWAGAKIGKNVRIVSSARFYLGGRLEIGDNTWIGHEVLFIGGDASVYVGSNVDIAPRVTIVTGSHELFTENNRAAGKGYSSPVVLNNGVWVGVGATILGGVNVGECGIIASGALVNKSVFPRTMVGGVPAKLIKHKV